MIDVGFSAHPDLDYVNNNFSATSSDNANHGNHVAGIACAKHDGNGTAGVLKKCFVDAIEDDDAAIASNASPVLEHAERFSYTLATLSRMIEATESGGAISLSLGYNWASNFQVNPDLSESGNYRAITQMQGRALLPVLDRAKIRDVVVFSAAGNDSFHQEPPRDARFASPFNWAASEARTLGVRNGVIVEAHGKDGSRAFFSNKNGSISCPGVDVLSTISLHIDWAKGVPVEGGYGLMSGTSMATPYCAAAFILLKKIRRKYSTEELLRCVEGSNRKSDTGTPIFDFGEILASCPSRVSSRP